MKKPYASPRITRIQLNHEQAVLSSCSTGVSSPSVNTNQYCKSNVCRRQNQSRGGDSAFHS